ncbi:MAG: AbrB family transcriptional regulator [Deltaproteobacteria bacterium]|nr:AbrB family transcriptional regulator [Deltaproteobacteria bacterium]
MSFLDGNLLWTLLAAFAGGYAGVKLKIPAGALIGALVATVAIRLLDAKAKEIPYIFGFLGQVFIGLIIGGGVTLELFEHLSKCWIPLVISMVGFIFIGLGFAFLIYKMGYLDFPTAYLGTSPGAMSAIVIVGVEYGANGAIVALFHFLRIILVLITAPIVFYFWGR